MVVIQLSLGETLEDFWMVGLLSEGLLTEVLLLEVLVLVCQLHDELEVRLLVVMLLEVLLLALTRRT